MQNLVKYFLLLLLTLPFIALATDTLGKTEGLMLKTAAGAGGASWLIATLMGGLHQRPNVANLYVWAFLA